MRRLAALAAAALWLAASCAEAAECRVVDWMATALPAAGDPVATALETAYPGSRLDREAGVFVTAEGLAVPFAPAREVDPATRLDDATIGDQFVYLYPLAFDLTRRRTPFEDPGRLRNDAFFKALYFDTARAVRRSLLTVAFEGRSRTTRFQATTKHCVHVQLAAALDQIERLSPDIDVYFEKSGGSFNWRRIAGTDRLSVHSFGIAFDLNTELGGYWRWAGVEPGQAADYDNRIPEEIVVAFERFGFIWGGKWHHFDGMHFEYRPELLLFARLATRH